MPDQTVHGPGGELPVAGFPDSDAHGAARVWVAPEQKVFGLVERGSTAVRLKVTSDTTITRPVSLASVQSTDHDVFYAEATSPKGKVRLLEVSWTDAAGHQQRHVVGRD